MNQFSSNNSCSWQYEDGDNTSSNVGNITYQSGIDQERLSLRSSISLASMMGTGIRPSSSGRVSRDRLLSILDEAILISNDSLLTFENDAISESDSRNTSSYTSPRTNGRKDASAGSNKKNQSDSQ